MPEQLLDFTGKVVLVTGGATGIGRATSLAFARQGAAVVIGDVDDRAAETVRLIEEAGGTGLFVRTDVTVAADVERLVNTAVDTYGGLHVAFNNAGILPPDRPAARSERSRLGPHHRRRPQGRVPGTQSRDRPHGHRRRRRDRQHRLVAGIIADPGMAPYVAAKHGVIGLTKAAAARLRHGRVRVNALAPGLVATGMTKGWLDDPEMRKVVVAGSQLGRPAEPEEIAGMVLYLTSDLASFATGGVYVVDGGQTAH